MKLSTAIELGYQGMTLNVGKDKAKGPLSQSAKVRQALDLAIDREAINQVVFNGEFKPGNQWVNPDHPYYQKAFPVPSRDVAKAKALLKEAGVTPPVNVDFMVPKGAETEAVAQVIQSMASEAGFDMKIRVTEFATSLKQAESGEYQAYHAGLERPDRSRRQLLRLLARTRRRTTAPLPMPMPTRRSTMRVWSPTSRSARRSMKSWQRSCWRKSRCSISITAAS